MERHEVLSFLKAEMSFLEEGGYRHSPRTPWKAPLMFEDSPTCLNFEQPNHPNPCANCGLMRFVPLRRHSARVPCRYIPLNQAGETVDGLYRYASQEELEDTVRAWLRRTIQKLDAEQARDESLKRNCELTFGVLPPGNGKTKLSD
ncbi:MAG: hypothetical protein M3O85_02945 [Acidobacteriota bacterium]|nr:hypothetical protein [Acidobacteriota bacterium]